MAVRIYNRLKSRPKEFEFCIGLTVDDFEGISISFEKFLAKTGRGANRKNTVREQVVIYCLHQRLRFTQGLIADIFDHPDRSRACRTVKEVGEAIEELARRQLAHIEDLSYRINEKKIGSVGELKDRHPELEFLISHIDVPEPEKLAPIRLSSLQRRYLHNIIKTHRKERVVIRATVIYGLLNSEAEVDIASELEVHTDTVRSWLKRWVDYSDIIDFIESAYVDELRYSIELVLWPEQLRRDRLRAGTPLLDSIEEEIQKYGKNIEGEPTE
jgi:hypothetical protein